MVWRYQIGKKGAALLKGFEQSKDCSIHKTFPFYNDQKAAYRFLSNDNVEEQILIDSMSRVCALQSIGKRVLAYCDTCTINTNSKIGRISDFTGLGLISRNQNKAAIGFFIHPLYIEDENNATPYGIAKVQLHNRSMERSTFDKSKRDVLRKIPIEEKESFKWVGPCIEVRDNVLNQAEHITYVMDREGDIIEVFERIPSSRSDVVVRNMHNRKIINSAGQSLRLNDQLSSQKANKRYTIQPKEEKGNEIKVTLKWGNCSLLAPRGHKLEEPLNVGYVEVKQVIEDNIDQVHKPVHWILLTSKKVMNEEQAKEVVQIYQRRWKIEVFFKLMKSDGYNIEKTELESGKAIRKLTLLLMQASTRLLQLKAARDGISELEVKEVFDKKEIQCLKILNTKMEGNTKKQKNPYAEDHLAWASWIIARLGGWTEYYNITRPRPPGNKTFKNGLDEFEAIMIGFNLRL